MDKEIFTLISREEDRNKLFADLAQAHGELLCKGTQDALVKLRARTFLDKISTLECAIESSEKLKESEEFLGYFFLGGEKYYFQGQNQIQGDKTHILVPLELYHLQRRQNYRVRIPQSFTASFNFKSINGKAQKISAPLADLSSQGCRVLYQANAPTLKIGDKVSGSVVVDNRTPIVIDGVIRHIKADEASRSAQALGIEFENLSPIVENNLFAMTMEIHKEIFRRP